MEGCAAWINARNLIKSGAQVDDIKDALSKLTKHEIENTYEDSQNLLHFAVSKNNLVVARFLFEKECFLPPHESGTVPYLHLACFYGFSDMVDLLCGWAKSLGTVTVFADDWRRFLEAHSVTGDEYEVFHAKIGENEGISAYRVAALHKHGACLRRLLGNYLQKDWPEAMAELGEVDCLRYLLDTEKFQPESLSSGFKSSLRANSPQCLEIMLEYIDKHNVYSTATNPFRLLYSATPSRSCSSGHPLVECTRLLIHHGWDVNVMEEQGTFPLYCLLKRIIDYDETRFCEGGHLQLKSLDDEFACLSELLAAGANPNFDERCDYGDAVFSTRVISLNQRAFSSAAEALAALIRPEINSILLDFISQTASLLEKYGCHMKGQRAWLGRIVEMDQAAGLKLLLAIMEFNLDALNYGFEKSLYHLSPSCSETMLQFAAENKVIYCQRNPFNFLYLYACDQFGMEGYTVNSSTAKCARVLIKHGWSVNEMNVPASYPLYTILRSTMGLYEESIYKESRIDIDLKETSVNLKILLEAGANPNFDESAIELSHSAGMPTSAFEGKLISEIRDYPIQRKSYSSGAAVLMDFVRKCAIDSDVLGFMAESVPLLVQYGCDMDHTNDEESILHIFFRRSSLNLEYLKRYFGLKKTLQQYGKVVSSLMAAGADIHGRDCHSKLPLTYFAEKLPDYISTFLTCHRYKDELGPILRIVDLMDFKEAQEIGMKFMEEIDNCDLGSSTDRNVLDGLKKEVQSHLNVRSLYNACLIKVLHYGCGYKLAKAQALELPLTIKDNLNKLFSF